MNIHLVISELKNENILLLYWKRIEKMDLAQILFFSCTNISMEKDFKLTLFTNKIHSSFHQRTKNHFGSEGASPIVQDINVSIIPTLPIDFI